MIGVGVDFWGKIRYYMGGCKAGYRNSVMEAKDEDENIGICDSDRVGRGDRWLRQSQSLCW